MVETRKKLWASQNTRERERERCGRRVRKKGKKEEGSDQEFWTNLVFFLIKKLS